MLTCHYGVQTLVFRNSSQVFTHKPAWIQRNVMACFRMRFKCWRLCVHFRQPQYGYASHFGTWDGSNRITSSLLSPRPTSGTTSTWQSSAGERPTLHRGTVSYNATACSVVMLVVTFWPLSPCRLASANNRFGRSYGLISISHFHYNYNIFFLFSQNIAVVAKRKGQPGSSVSTVSGYGLDDQTIEVRSPAEAKGFFLQPLCPDWLWGPPSLLYNGYRGSFSRGKSAAGTWGWPLTPI
jgi:hypothetical protein